MKRMIFKIIPSFIMIASILCGCGANEKSLEANKKVITQEEKASEYNETDKPWGESNYKKIGVIKSFEKNLDDNVTTAVLSVDAENTINKLKIYGTDINVGDYEGKNVFISAVKNDDVSKDYVLVKRYEDINLVDLGLITSIKTLDSIDNNDDLNKVKGNIESVGNVDYRSYVTEIYNAKVEELNIKKNNEEIQRKAYEEQQAEKKRQEEEKLRQQQSNENRQANENVQTNGDTVYIAASGKGKKYHNDSTCSNMNGNVNTMSRSQAEQSGYSACKKCYK